MHQTLGLLDRLGSLSSHSAHERDVSERIAEQSAIDHWLGQLSVDDQRVVLLFNAGFENDEIARILGCSPAAAAKRRTRARSRLQTIVNKERGTE